MFSLPQEKSLCVDLFSVIKIEKWKTTVNVIQLLLIKKKKLFRQHLFISANIHQNDKKIIAKCFVNCKIITKFILQILIKTLNLNQKKPWKKNNKIKTLNNHKIFTYGKHELKIHLINLCYFSLILNVEVMAVNVSKYNVILNLFWLQKYNSLINWTNFMIKWSKNHVFKTSDVVFSNKKQNFFNIRNKHEEIADFNKIKLKNTTDGPQKDWKKDQHVCSAENPYENIAIFIDSNVKHFVENPQMNFVNFTNIQFINVKSWHWYKHKKNFKRTYCTWII